MKQYIVIRRPADFSWDKIPSLAMDAPLRPTESTVRATAQLCYDDTALYVRLSAIEANIRAEHHGPLGEICEDSCLEFFFSPMSGDRRYFNIECNPNGALYLGMGSDAHNLVRFMPEEPSILPQTARTADGWETVYTVLYSFIRCFFPTFAPKSGDTIRANFYKCGDLTETPHYFCWNPVPILPYASFHNPDAFGTLIFE